MKNTSMAIGIILLALLFLSISPVAFAQDEEPIDEEPAEEMTSAEQPRIDITFLYVLCNDVDEMRHFYTDLVGMEETNYWNDEDWQWLCYDSNGMEFMFFGFFEEVPVQEEWAWQPGWGGDVPLASWSILLPEDQFDDVVLAIHNDMGIKVLEEWPEWRQDSYWGYTVMDPMGNTVELYTVPSEAPEETEWIVE